MKENYLSIDHARLLINIQNETGKASKNKENCSGY